MLAAINWKPSNTDMRKFGLTLIIGFALIGGFLYWQDFHHAARLTWGIASGVGILAIAFPFLAKPFYYLWMGVAFVMGTIISTLILLFVFFCIITPIGLFMRIIGRDALRLKKTSYENDSYWVDHPKIENRDYYERLF